MGTRNLTIVKMGGKIKVAQYCQWDGNPTGQGADIARFIQCDIATASDLKVFKKNVAKLKWATAKQVKTTWNEAGADPESNMVSFDIAEKHSKMYPEFSRDTGAKVLESIQDGKVERVKNDHAFIKDSLFCEFAYLIDLDKKTVSVYKGFQASGRMETIKRADGSTYKAEKYNPCKEFKTFKFKDFTVSAMTLLEREMYGKND